MKKVILISLLFFYVNSLAFDIDRRKDQYKSTPGYIFVPAPYSLPGIGEGLFLLGMANNINNTQTDFIADIITGDVSGYGIGLMDWYPINKHLKIDMFHEGLDKATIQSYSNRGMNSNKDDFVYVYIDDMKFTGIRATSSFYEKMLEFYLMSYSNEYSIDSLKDKDENLIYDSNKNQSQKSNIYTTGFMIDYTDDRVDPRVGLRFDFSLDYSNPEDSKSVDFYTTNYNITAYIPIAKQSTWAFNYFRSSANVISKGDTNFTSVSQSLGLDCSTLNGQDKIDCQNVVNNQILANKNGTATTLGGRTRLRSYPEMRFIGAHTEFYGTELRWNWTDEITPFDIWFMKDIRTSIQTAMFYERGSVAENIDDLGKNEKQSYGLGVRMITGSGLVYRFDIASGDEDTEYTIIINYPWELF